MPRWLWLVPLLSACASNEPPPRQYVGPQYQPAPGYPPPGPYGPSPSPAPTPAAGSAPAQGSSDMAAQMSRLKVNRAQVDGNALATIATVWRAEHRNAPCPDFATLARDRALPEGFSSVDPWGHPYAITCNGDRATVTSAGPDGRFGTPDDIIRG